MAELARKKKIRAGHRASTTRILGQIDPCLAAVPFEASKVTQCKRSLESKLQALTTLDDEILDLTDDDGVEAEIVQADEVKESIYRALSRLELALTTPPSRLPETPAVRSSEPPTAEVTERRNLPEDKPDEETAHRPPWKEATVRLPKIALPRFGGDPVKWTSFWDSYQSAVHLNSALSDVDKFNYLRSLLDHTAFDAVAGLTLSEANYQQAIEILLKRFGNRQVIISKHMDTLMRMDPISSDRHLRDLRRFYDHTESHVRSLKSLGIEAASYGALLSPVLLAKLPPELRLIVSRKLSDTDLNVDDLLATFEEELTARERANPQLVHRRYRETRNCHLRYSAVWIRRH